MVSNTIWFFYGLMVVAAAEFGKKHGASSIEDPKPVFLVHGILASGNLFEYVETKIKKHNPQTIVYNTYAYAYLDSFTPLQEQIDGTLGQQFRNFSDAHPGGIHLIGHSQGAILGRALIQSYPQHNVHNFISIAGPQAGQYGMPTIIAQLMPIANFVGPPLWNLESYIAYNPEAQRKLSIANLWNDPTKHEMYLKVNTFLPHYNNEKPSKRSKFYKEAFVKLKNFIAILGPDDGVIDPWQSGDFSYYDRFLTVVNYTTREVYEKDLFGLRTLDEQGRFIKHIKPGVEHVEFLFNSKVLNECILPWLN